MTAPKPPGGTPVVRRAALPPMPRGSSSAPGGATPPSASPAGPAPAPKEAEHAPGVHRLARELAQATEELTRNLSRAEGAMVTLNLGVPVEIDIADPDEPPTSVAFKKHDNKWGLYIVKTIYEGVDEREELTPIVSSSKLMRLRAARVLPRLLDRARKEALAQLEAMREGTKAVEEFVASLDAEDFPAGAKGTAPAEAFDDIPGNDEIPF